jgi:nitrate reductase assembly molybdenum cofactor insertion protein NarJ
MSDATVDDETIRSLFREAATWRLLGRLFECPRERWHDDIEGLARELGDDELLIAASSARLTATEGQYHSVFGPGGPAPPREATYHDSLELGSLMTELVGYYRAFAYAPSLDEPPDHIAVEIGFVAYLKLKQAYALARGENDGAMVAERATHTFVTDHLAVMAEPLARLLAESPLEYLARASRAIASKIGPRPHAKRLPMLPPPTIDEDEGSEFPCAIH